MPSTKQVVFPDPLWAWAIRFLCGGSRIIGSVSAWILLGFSNFITLKIPSKRLSFRPSSLNVLADLYGV